LARKRVGISEVTLTNEEYNTETESAKAGEIGKIPDAL